MEYSWLVVFFLQHFDCVIRGLDPFYAAEVLAEFLLITSVLTSASDRLLMSMLSSSFSGVLICSFIWAMFLFSSFWQPPCVCVYVLGRAAMTLCLGSMV